MTVREILIRQKKEEKRKEFDKKMTNFIMWYLLPVVIISQIYFFMPMPC